jgi:hypothetical protein
MICSFLLLPLPCALLIFNLDVCHINVHSSWRSLGRPVSPLNYPVFVQSQSASIPLSTGAMADSNAQTILMLTGITGCIDDEARRWLKVKNSNAHSALNAILDHEDLTKAEVCRLSLPAVDHHICPKHFHIENSDAGQFSQFISLFLVFLIWVSLALPSKVLIIFSLTCHIQSSLCITYGYNFDH